MALCRRVRSTHPRSRSRANCGGWWVQVIAADDVRQSWRARGVRFIELRSSGLFRQVDVAIGVDPPGFADAIVFAKPRTRDYRLLIDGEFYQVVAHE